MRRIDCREPEGNSFFVIAQVCEVLREQGVPNEAVHGFIVAMLASVTYWELLDAAITFTEGQLEFINIPERH